MRYTRWLRAHADSALAQEVRLAKHPTYAGRKPPVIGNASMAHIRTCNATTNIAQSQRGDCEPFTQETPKVTRCNSLPAQDAAKPGSKDGENPEAGIQRQLQRLPRPRTPHPNLYDYSNSRRHPPAPKAGSSVVTLGDMEGATSPNARSPQRIQLPSEGGSRG